MLSVWYVFCSSFIDKPEIKLSKFAYPVFNNETILFYSSWHQVDESVLSQPFDRRIDCSLHMLLCRRYGAAVLPALADCYSDGTCNQIPVANRTFWFNIHDSGKFSTILDNLEVRYPVLRRYNFEIRNISADAKEELVGPDGVQKLADLSERKILQFCQLHQFDGKTVVLNKHNANGVLQSEMTFIVFNTAKSEAEFTSRSRVSKNSTVHAIDPDYVLCKQGYICIAKLSGEQLTIHTEKDTSRVTQSTILRLVNTQTEPAPDVGIVQRFASNFELVKLLKMILQTGAAIAIGTALAYAFLQKRNAENQPNAPDDAQQEQTSEDSREAAQTNSLTQ